MFICLYFVLSKWELLPVSPESGKMHQLSEKYLITNKIIYKTLNIYVTISLFSAF